MQRSSPAKRAARPGCVAAIALSALVALAGAAAPASAAPTVDEVATNFGLSKEDIQRVRNGELVKTTTRETSDLELAAVMVFLVRAPVQKLVASLEVGPSSRYDPQVQSVTEIRGDGTLEDFKAAVLEPGGEKEAQRYLNAAPGDTLNLSLPEIASLAKLKAAGDRGQPQVENAVRRLLLGRYQAYRARGLASIAPYVRGKDKQSQVAGDLRRATEAAGGIKKYAPTFYDALMKYPQGIPTGLTERFFCIRYALSGRPNFVLRHRLVFPVEDAYLVANRDFYVSSVYNDTQAVAGFLPVENGTVVVYLNRTTTDQLGGFGVSAKKAIGRNMMAKQLGEIFEKARAGLGK